MPRRLFLLLLLLATTSTRAAAQAVGWDAGLDATIDSAMKAFHVPGLALAVVKGNKVLYIKGYGYRDVARKLPVTPNTMFPVASITKSFAATVLASLVKDGKLEWDKPVRTYLSDFQLNDPVASERISVRDLITNRTGMPRHDLLWTINEFTREQLYGRLRYLELSRDMRTTWQYANLMFMTSGILAGRVAGSTWDDLVQQRVFAPLRMRTATTSLAAYTQSPDHAEPYAWSDVDTLMHIPFRSFEQVGAAGNVQSTIDEMSRYLIMHLRDGVFENDTIMRPADAREIHRPQMAMAKPMLWENGEFPELGDETYGMGMLVNSYRGHKLVHNPGNNDGFALELSMLPNDSLGVMVLTNMYSTTLRDFVQFLVYDRLLGLPRVDWTGRFRARAARSRAATFATRAREDSMRIKGSLPSHTLDAYVGRYVHPGYGTMAVSRTATGLQVSWGAYTFPLEHYHYDVFRLGLPAGDPTYARFRMRITFQTGVDGSISVLSAPVEAAVAPTVFSRVKGN